MNARWKVETVEESNEKEKVLNRLRHANVTWHGQQESNEKAAKATRLINWTGTR